MNENPTGFDVGDWVKLGHSEYEYEVAEIRRFPHGFMVGIYDEPPSKHVDFWNASSLTLSRSAKPETETLQIGTQPDLTLTVSLQRSHYLAFHAEGNKRIGELAWGDGTLRFTGDADESARVFFRCMAQHMGLPTDI